MFRPLVALTAGLAAALVVLPALADRDLASIARTARGTGAAIDVTAHYLAPSPCYRYAGKRSDVPAGAGVPDIAVPLTVVVVRGEGSCPARPTLLRETFVVFPKGNTINVKVFFVSPEGRLLKSEEIAVMN